MGRWKKRKAPEEESYSLGDKVKFILRKVALHAVIGLLLALVGMVVGLLIAGHYEQNVQNVMFVEGVILVIVGIMASMKGNPSIAGLKGLDVRDATVVNRMNLETTVMERDVTNYYKNFRKQAVVEYGFGRMTLIFGGVILAAIGILFF